MLNAYSLTARLTLFMMPLYIFVCSKGVREMIRMARSSQLRILPALAALLPATLLAALTIEYSALPYFGKPYPSVAFREGLQQLQSRAIPGDVIFFSQYGRDAYRYYGHHYAGAVVLNGVDRATVKPYQFDRIPGMADSLRKVYPGQRIILVDSHTWGEELSHLRKLTHTLGARTLADTGATRIYVFEAEAP
ncbi:MAG: hypothetical protein KF690_01640 [Bacteroidetes bacterium]|nr:hypothetical protein [Bacteroidota bacterium]